MDCRPSLSLLGGGDMTAFLSLTLVRPSVWKKMHRSTMTSRSLDSYVSDYRHTEKCEKVLLDRERDLDSASVMLVAKYPSCPVVSR